MPISIVLPSTTYPWIGPGQVIHVGGMTPATAGDRLVVNAIDDATGVYVVTGIVPLAAGDTSANPMLGVVLDPPLIGIAGFTRHTVVLGVDGEPMHITVEHLDIGFATVESGSFSGYLWNRVGDVAGFFHALVEILGSSSTTISSDVAAIKAAVIHEYTSA